MEFLNFGNRIKPLVNFDTFEQPVNEYKQVGRFTIKKGEMVTTSVMKIKFSQLNGKRFYFPNGVLSLPYGHPSLRETNDFKKEKGQKIEDYFWEEKENLLKMEKRALKNTSRLDILNQILNQEPKIVNLNAKDNFSALYPTKIKENIQNIVLSAEWMKQNFHLMGNLKEISLLLVELVALKLLS